MHNPASVLESNDTQKLPWDFDIQTAHLISVKRPDIKKKINKNKKRRELKKLWNMQVTIMSIVMVLLVQ